MIVCAHSGVSGFSSQSWTRASRTSSLVIVLDWTLLIVGPDKQLTADPAGVLGETGGEDT